MSLKFRKHTLCLVGLLLFCQSSFAKKQTINIYMVKYPPFYISDGVGLGPDLINDLNQHIDPNYQLKIKILPPKRMVKHFGSLGINFLFHSPTHFNEQEQSSLKILPLVKLIDRYAFIKESHKKNPTLGFFLGDTEEKNKMGKDLYKRVPVSDPTGLFGMLTKARVDYINCLVPMCQFLAKKEKVKLKFKRKISGVDTTYGGIIIKQDKSKTPESLAIRNALKKALLKNTYQKVINQYAIDLKMQPKDLLLRDQSLVQFLKLSNPLLLK